MIFSGLRKLKLFTIICHFSIYYSNNFNQKENMKCFNTMCCTDNVRELEHHNRKANYYLLFGQSKRRTS
jgi:hypothetical protein